jgi:hypothetical protein
VREEFDCEYRESSAMTGEGIDEVFNEATRIVLTRRGVLSTAPSAKHKVVEVPR